MLSSVNYVWSILSRCINPGRSNSPARRQRERSSTNCKNGNGALSSQIAYFSGAVSGVPDAIVTVHSGSTVVWEGNTVTGTFSNGNQFTSQIVSPKVAAGAYAGPSHSNYGDFSC
jgi:hypothetical protein